MITKDSVPGAAAIWHRRGLSESTAWGSLSRYFYAAITAVLVLVGLVAAPVTATAAATGPIAQEVVLSLTLTTTDPDFRLPTQAPSGISYGWVVQISKNGGPFADANVNGGPHGYAEGVSSPNQGSWPSLGLLGPGNYQIRLKPLCYPGGCGSGTGSRAAANFWGWFRAFSVAGISQSSDWVHRDDITAVGDLPYLGIASGTVGATDVAKNMFANAKNLKSIGSVLDPARDADWAATKSVGSSFFEGTFMGTGLTTLPDGSFSTGGITSVTGDSFFKQTFKKTGLQELPSTSFKFTGLAGSFASKGAFYEMFSEAKLRYADVLQVLKEWDRLTVNLGSTAALGTEPIFSSAFYLNPAAGFLDKTMFAYLGSSPATSLGTFSQTNLCDPQEERLPWGLPKCPTITYNANGGTGSMDPTVVIINTETLIANNTYQKEGYLFDGWTSSEGAATYPATGGKITLTKDVTLSARWKADSDLGVPDLNNSRTRVYGESLAVPVGGSRTVTTEVLDKYDNAVQGVTVVFSHPTLGEKTAVTGINGIANVSYTSTTAGTFDVVATIGGQPIKNGDPGTDPAAGRINFATGPVSADKSDFTVGSASAKADGSESVQLSVTLRDQYGNLVTGGSPVASALPSANVSLNGNSYTSTQTGVYTLPITSTSSGDKVVTVKVGGVAIKALGNDTARFTAGPVSLEHSSFHVTNTAGVRADGVETQVLSVNLRDAYLNPVEGAAAGLQAVGAPDSLSFGGFTDAGGGAYQSLVTSVIAKEYTVGVKYDAGALSALPAGANITTFVAGDPNVANQNTTIKGQSGIGVVGGTRTVTATIVDAQGSPVPGATVTFLHTTAMTPATGVTASTNANGVASVDFLSTVAGEFRVSATVSGGSVQNAVIKFGDVDASGTDPAYAKIAFGSGVPSVAVGSSSFLVSETAGVYANGEDAQTITVTLKDASGNLTDLPSGWLLSAAGGAGYTVGVFTPGVEASTYVATVTASKPGSYPMVVTLNQDATQIGSVTAAGNKDATFLALSSSKPVVDEPTDKGVSGKGVPGAEITVTDPVTGANLCKATPVVVKPDGMWSCEFKEPQLPGTDIDVVQKEDGKDPSEKVTVTVPDPEVSKPPTDVVVDEDGASGKGEPGAEVEVTDPETGENLCKEQPVIVKPDGTWSCEFTEPREPGSEVEVGQKEDGKDPSDTVTVTVPGRSEKPVVDEPTDKGVSGKGTPGAEITVTDPETGANLCKTTPVIVDGDGNWRCEFKEPQDPGAKIDVVQKEDGKKPSDTVTVTVPDPEVSKPPTDVVVDEDGASGKGEPGAEVEVTDPETGENLCKEQPVIVKPDGTWSCEFTEPREPGTDVEVGQKEDGKDPSDTVTVTVPDPEVSKPPTDVVVDEDGASGKGEPGAEVEVTDPETGENLCKEQPVIVKPDGTWSCEFTEPREPGSEVEVGQKEDGKDPSDTVTVTVPGRSEKPVVDEPTDKGVSGKGTPGAEITVTDPETGANLCKTTPVIVDGDGNWRCEFKEPQDPGAKIDVVQKEDGKKPSDTVTVTVPDRSKPPVIDEVTDEKVSGKDGVPGAEITVTDPVTGENLCKDQPVIVKPDGTWSCEFKKPQEPGSEVEVSQKEDGKLPSGKETVTVPSLLDKSEMPTDVVAGEKGVTGRGVPGAEITVTLPGSDVNLCKAAPVVVKADGTWSCEFTQSQKPGNGVDVVQQEDGKAPSEKVTVTVQADEVGPLQIVRYSGVDRYGTSLDLNSRRLVKGKPVFVATGGNFPDSLSAGPAVTVQGGSLVLSNKGSMKAGMLTHIGNAEPSMVYIIGETGAISKDVEKQLTDKFGALKVKRVGGVDRYATSAMIASEFFKDVDVSMAFVASGVNFPDALTASAVGGALTAPVLLVAGGKNASVLNPGMSGFLSSKGVRELVIAGGEVAVGPKLEEELDKSFTVSRAGGVDRYATNLLVNALLDSKFPDTQLRGVWLAAGANFPDALSAAVPAGKADQRLVLARKSCVSGTVVDWVVKADSKVDFVGIVGGTAVLASVFERESTLKDARCPN